MNPLRSHENSRNISSQSQNCGIHSLAINPSGTLLATGSENVNDIAIYRLPSLEPLYVGWDAHYNWIFDSVWIDDTHVVSGAGDSKLALWTIDENDNNNNYDDSENLNNNFIDSNSNSLTNSSFSEYDVQSSSSQMESMLNSNEGNYDEDSDASYFLNKRRRIDTNGKFKATNSYSFKTATKVITCKKGKRIRALTFNKKNNEIAAIAMNASFHTFNTHRFVQVINLF